MKPHFNMFAISDNHFLHENIIKYCSRPFKTRDDMDERMKKNWNATVKEGDVVIHLGDLIFTAGSAEVIKTRIAELNGRIILVKGNHDRKGNIWYLNNGIDFVCDRFVWDYNGKRILFVHNPAHVSPEDILKYHYILHGHQHNNTPFITKVGKCTFVNLSVEHIKYTPIPLVTLLNRLGQGYYNNKKNL